VGYQVNENVIFNVDLGYFRSFKGGFYQYINVSQTPGSFVAGPKADIEFLSTYYSATPGVIIQSGNKENKLRPYARFGLIIAGSNVQSTTNVEGVSGKSVNEYSGGISVGFLGGMGLYKQLNENVKFFAELDVKTITAYPKEKVNTENFTGAPKAPTVRFVDNVSPTGSTTNQLTFPIPLSSFGLSVGLQYKI
jgi:hypothetical protein